VFSVTIRDHMMVAHSLQGAVFGPAQRLRGARYVVDASFRSEAFDADSIVVDIGHAAADHLAARVNAGAFGEAARGLAGIAVTLRESHVAWATYERTL
jgi:hypothetical protein